MVQRIVSVNYDRFWAKAAYFCTVQLQKEGVMGKTSYEAQVVDLVYTRDLKSLGES